MPAIFVLRVGIWVILSVKKKQRTVSPQYDCHLRSVLPFPPSVLPFAARPFVLTAAKADLKQRAEYAKPHFSVSLWGVCPPVSQPCKICDGEISAIISSSAMKTERSVEWCFKALAVEAKRNGKTCHMRLSCESRFAADTVMFKSWCLLKDLHL